MTQSTTFLIESNEFSGMCSQKRIEREAQNRKDFEGMWQIKTYNSRERPEKVANEIEWQGEPS